MHIQLTGSNHPFTANSSIFYNNGLKSTQEKLQRQADRDNQIAEERKEEMTDEGTKLAEDTTELTEEASELPEDIIVFLRREIVSSCDLHWKKKRICRYLH